MKLSYSTEYINAVTVYVEALDTYHLQTTKKHFSHFFNYRPPEWNMIVQ